MIIKILAILICAGNLFSVKILQDENPAPFLQIVAYVNKKNFLQGQEGVLKLKIVPRQDINISVYPEMLIRLKTNPNFIFAKNFFTASELDFLTFQEKENDLVYYNLEKEINLPFSVYEAALLGKLKIEGEVAFTAIFKENRWCLKTYQPFEVDFVSQLNRNPKKKNRVRSPFP